MTVPQLLIFLVLALFLLGFMAWISDRDEE